MYKDGTMAQAGTGCTDCHMARIANRSDATQKNMNHWDVSSHTFKVVMPQAADTLKIKSSCEACHEGSNRAAKGAYMAAQQTEIKSRIVALESAISAFEKKGKKANEARKLLAMVKDDRSFGAHNPEKAMALLDKALKHVVKK